jgi:L-ribulose-5-phosphate 4-epimerase
MRLPELRAAVAEANVALERHGLVTLSFGNVSGVDRAAGVMVIKPSGMPYAGLSAEDMVVVALDDGQVIEGSLRPSVDTPTHRVLYQKLPEIAAIVHTHSPYATAWAQARREIPSFGTTHADHFRGPVLVTRPLTADEIAGDYEWETGRVIVETLRSARRTAVESPAVLVASHGPFAWGGSPAVAVDNAVALEVVAAMAFRTLQIEAAASEIKPALLARHFDRKHGRGAYYGQPGPDDASADEARD